MFKRSKFSSPMLKEKVNFETVLSSELYHIYSINEDVSRKINLNDSKGRVNGAVARVWANELSTLVQNQYRSSKRNVNHVQHHGYFCTDGSSQIWQQYSSTDEKVHQSQTVFDKSDLYCVDQGSSKSQSTKSTRNEYFERKSILRSPNRAKTRHIELKSTLNYLCSTTSAREENLNYLGSLHDFISGSMNKMDYYCLYPVVAPLNYIHLRPKYSTLW